MAEGDGGRIDRGGGILDACEATATAELGEPICLTRAGSIDVKVALPDGAPQGIAVFLHGDTANAWLDDFGYEYLIEATRGANLVLVAALAPNRCSWWRAPDECDFEVEDSDGVNAAALAEALGLLAAELDIEGTPVRYVGYSGGSTFLTGHFLPLFGDAFPGPMVANCGGEVPIYDFTWDIDDDATRSALPITFTFGSLDFMTEFIEPAVRQLSGLEFAVTRTEIQGADHCDAGVDWDAITLQAWGLQ